MKEGHQEPVDLQGALISPSFDRWIDIAQKNSSLIQTWSTRIAGVPISGLRELAREECVSAAWEYSRRIGVPLTNPGNKVSEPLLIMTGAAPTLYHPGVWSKVFMIQRFAEHHGALAIDAIVDTDRYPGISVQVPKLVEGKATGHNVITLRNESFAGYFSAVAPPEPQAVEDFCVDVDNALSVLPDPAWRHSFRAFCRALIDSAPLVNDAGELVTFARRRYEADAGNDYLESPVSAWSEMRSFRLYATDIIASAHRYTAAYNDELAIFRAAHKVRTAAQPLPDLRASGDLYEMPFWVLQNGKRRPLYCKHVASRVKLYAEDEPVADISSDPEEIAGFLLSVSLAPKALALTVFARMLLADLFVHGVGGGRYDQVADGLIRRYYGVAPPEFVVVSVDAGSPLSAGSGAISKQLSQARDELKRFRHQPEDFFQSVYAQGADPDPVLRGLAEKKASLIEAIRRPGAQKKLLAQALKDVNLDLAKQMSPTEASLIERVSGLEVLLKDMAVLSDRNYPFCFFDPRQFADRLR